MSWTNELYKVYELASNAESLDNEKHILPISHSTSNAQIELTISESGEFVNACTIEKENAETIIPVTEDSCARGNGVYPMPLADKLVYIAGDYSEYANGKNAENSKYFNAYMAGLKKWAESEYTHKSVKAIFTYLEKRELMKDLIESNVLVLDENTNRLLDTAKIAGIQQADSFVRFRVGNSETWLDKTLYDCFDKLNQNNMKNIKLCYATGKEVPVTYKHPAKIRNSGDKAKLISSNDERGFTYRGRFSNKEEAISVGYEFSQKMHNALKWLIVKQGISMGSLTLVVWASGLKFIPNPLSSMNEYGEEEEEEEYDSVANYRERMKKYIFGHSGQFSADDNAMIIILDAAITGRLSISEYSEINASQYLENIAKWHSDTVWLQFDSKNKRNKYDSFSVKNIATYAFGTEQGDFVKCKEEVLHDTVLRLLPCITARKKLPKDIMTTLYMRASNPLSYNKYNFTRVLETACGMIQKYYIDYDVKRGREYMAYDQNINDRSYLFGCLLAIADKAESDTYDKADSRVTNAKRYWNAFSQRPAQTWKIIEERLRPYLNKLGKAEVKYSIWINEILDKLDAEQFNNSKLEPLYLLGYHNFTSYMYKSKKTEE